MHHKPQVYHLVQRLFKLGWYTLYKTGGHMCPDSLLQTHFPSKETVDFINIKFSLMIPAVLYILYKETPMIQEVFFTNCRFTFQSTEDIILSLLSPSPPLSPSPL